MGAIGIDLGTTNSCVGHYENGQLKILKNRRQDFTTPSVIGFREGEILYGRDALRLFKQPHNIISDVKRFIGLPFLDEKVQENIEMNRWPFSVVNSNGRINVVVELDEGKYLYTAEELSALLIKELKNSAEETLKKEIKSAVITVPSHFSDSQRQATIDAGKLAGLGQVTLLNEPTAAAVAYGHYNNITSDSIFLIFDFGGGTFDVSIIKFESGIYDVLAIDGDLHLGGVDIDNRLLDHFSKQINLDLGVPRNRTRFRAACEELKIELTCSKKSSLDLSDENVLELTAEEFNRINQDLFNKTIQIVDRCIQRINLNKNDITHVVLVGGSSRIPKISEMLMEYFQKDVKSNINQDEAVAMGAALVANKKLEMRNICPYALGVEIKGGRMRTIIPKYSKLPIEKSETFQTAKKGQDIINIKIYQGDHEFTNGNKFLGNFIISGIAKVREGVVREIFRINEDGILLVSAVAGVGNPIHLKIQLESGSLTASEMAMMKEKLSQNHALSEDTKAFKQNVLEFQKLKKECNAAETEKLQAPTKFSPTNKENLDLMMRELRVHLITRNHKQ